MRTCGALGETDPFTTDVGGVGRMLGVEEVGVFEMTVSGVLLGDTEVGKLVSKENEGL